MQYKKISLVLTFSVLNGCSTVTSNVTAIFIESEFKKANKSIYVQNNKNSLEENQYESRGGTHCLDNKSCILRDTYVVNLTNSHTMQV